MRGPRNMGVMGAGVGISLSAAVAPALAFGDAQATSLTSRLLSSTAINGTQSSTLDTALQRELRNDYANITAAPVADPDEIRRLLVEQVTGTVRWRESVLAMQEAGVQHFVELGGKVLGPMIKRIAPDAEAVSVVSMDDLEALAKAL